ncbi:hypothetical protein V8F33_013598 [Rhypophila sp. PSN 637]
MGDLNPSVMRPSGGDLPLESPPVTGQAPAQSNKRPGDASLSDERLLKRKRAELNRNSHGCIYFKWNIEFVTSAEHEEQKRALLRTESQPKPNPFKTEPAPPQQGVNRPKAEPTSTQAIPAPPETEVNSFKAQPVATQMPTVAQPKPALLLAKPDQPELKPPLPQSNVNLPKAQPVATQVPTVGQSKPALLLAEPPIAQSEPNQLEVNPPLPQPKVILPTTEPIGKVMPTAIQPQLKPNLETTVILAKPTVTQATPALSQPKPGTLVSTGFTFSSGSPTLTRLGELVRRAAGGPCASCNNPNHVVAVCPWPTEAPFGAIPFCPVHNSRTHSFDDCEQTKLRIHLSDVTAPPEPNAGSNTKLPAEKSRVIKDIPYFIHYLIKNRVNRPPILSAQVCWLNLAVQSPVEMAVANPRGFPWTKEFSRMVRGPYVFEELCHGKVHWSKWDPNRHDNGTLPVDPALRHKFTGQIKDIAQIRQELSDGRLKSQTIMNGTG